MNTWLIEAIQACTLPPQAETYLFGRGVSSDMISDLGLCVWQNLATPAPHEEFCKKYGSRGQKLAGWLVTPLYSPRSKLVGFEARSMKEKRVSRFLLGQAAWNPVWIGIQDAMPKIWDGGAVWIVEGVFDLTAMRRVVSQRDAVLSSLQARVTDEHLTFLKRFVSSVNMVYDHDEAGRRATRKALSNMRKIGIPCRDIPYRNGKDPGEIWEKFGDGGLRSAFSVYL